MQTNEEMDARQEQAYKDMEEQTDRHQKLTVHCKKDEFDVYVGRPSIWSNPWSHVFGYQTIQVENRHKAIDNYMKWLIGSDFTDFEQERRKQILERVHELKGKVLGCWCAPKACHALVLHMFADGMLEPNDKED